MSKFVIEMHTLLNFMQSMMDRLIFIADLQKLWLFLAGQFYACHNFFRKTFNVGYVERIQN